MQQDSQKPSQKEIGISNRHTGKWEEFLRSLDAQEVSVDRTKNRSIQVL
jgi:hypothetical protein